MVKTPKFVSSFWFFLTLLFVPPAFPRYNLQRTLHIFKVYNRMIQCYVRTLDYLLLSLLIALLISSCLFKHLYLYISDC